MKYLRDTNICIYAVKHKPADVIRNILKHDVDETCISFITYAQLMHGESRAVECNRMALAMFLPI